MGGPGSGNWYRWNKKITCEEVRRIDIRDLKKRGWLEPCCRRQMFWECNGKDAGNIEYQVTENALILSYRSRSNPNTEWEDIEETVRFDRTPCNYGNKRLWFRCPHCERRVAVLYGLSSRFFCRHCTGLSYSSQNESDLDRMMRKARKIRNKLGASDGLDEPIWRKPKGMHQQTFEQLMMEDEKVIYAVNHAMVEKLNMFRRL